MKILINRVESSGKDCGTVAPLYSGDMITVSRKWEEFLKFCCKLFKGHGACDKDTLVTFQTVNKWLE